MLLLAPALLIDIKLTLNECHVKVWNVMIRFLNLTKHYGNDSPINCLVRTRNFGHSQTQGNGIPKVAFVVLKTCLVCVITYRRPHRRQLYIHWAYCRQCRGGVGMVWHNIPLSWVRTPTVLMPQLYFAVSLIRSIRDGSTNRLTDKRADRWTERLLDEWDMAW